MSEPKFDQWAIVQVFGHTAYAGRVSEASIGGASFVRIDVPEVEDCKAFTKFLGASSIFDITPCDEETARRAAGSFRMRPFAHLTTIRVPQLTNESGGGKHPYLGDDPNDWDEGDDDE